MLMPILGFLNCLVYVRRHYKRWKELDPGMAFSEAVWRCIQAETPSLSELNSSSRESRRPGSHSVTPSMDACAPQSVKPQSSGSDSSNSVRGDDTSHSKDELSNLEDQDETSETKFEICETENTSGKTEKLPRRSLFRQNISSGSLGLPVVAEEDSEEIIFDSLAPTDGEQSSSAPNEESPQQQPRPSRRMTRTRESGVFGWLERSMSFSMLVNSSRTLDEGNETTPVSHMSLNQSRAQMTEEHGNAFKSGFF